MIYRSADFAYPQLERTTYKDEPGTWVAVSRRLLAPESQTAFETRYFEIAPHGYTSYERHAHEHVVVVLRGAGEAQLGQTWAPVKEGDVVHVQPHVPHQFRNPHAEPFGILCVVNRDRDRPVLLNDDGTPRPPENE
ncbi:MAG: cupin domain-containing protein [Fimbriimonadaceae bacterium]|nr:cupin domain-containing protein [Fimbriimonadaceae bacterium]